MFTLKTAAQWLIPDVPQKLSERMRREARIVTQLMIKREKESAVNNAGKHLKILIVVNMKTFVTKLGNKLIS